MTFNLEDMVTVVGPRVASTEVGKRGIVHHISRQRVIWILTHDDSRVMGPYTDSQLQMVPRPEFRVGDQVLLPNWFLAQLPEHAALSFQGLIPVIDGIRSRGQRIVVRVGMGDGEPAKFEFDYYDLRKVDERSTEDTPPVLGGPVLGEPTDG